MELYLSRDGDGTPGLILGTPIELVSDGPQYLAGLVEQARVFQWEQQRRKDKERATSTWGRLRGLLGW